MCAPANGSSAISFSQALKFWFKLGFINFGGPAGQIAIMHRELVEERQWISEERFLHALNFCMLLPGPEAQQLAIYIGWLKHGIRGGVAAGILFVLPGFLLIVGISAIYSLFHNWAPLQGVLFGIKAAVVAIVIEAALRIGKRALKSPTNLIAAAIAFVALFFFAIPFPLVILLAAGFGFAVHRKNESREDGAASQAIHDQPIHTTKRYSLKVVIIGGLIWFAPLLILALALGSQHVLVVQGLFFSKMAVVTFGGAYAALSYVAQQAVDHYGWLQPNDMLQGLGLAETTPGPLILVLTYVGFLASFRDAAPFDPLVAGVLGATLTTWVTFVPCFLWIFLGAPYIERLRTQAAISSALTMITAAVVGVIANLAVWFSMHALFREVRTIDSGPLHLSMPILKSADMIAIAIAAFAALALLRLKWPVPIVLGLCAVAGLLQITI